MPLFRDEAITLRYFDFGEADRIVSFFCKRHGKIRAVAKGARKIKSRFAGRLEPFHSVEVVLYGKEHASLFKLSGVEFAGARRGFSSNLDKFLRACYISELIDRGLKDHDPNPQAYQTAVEALNMIEKEPNVKALDWIVRFFDVKFLSSLGYHPTTDRCVKCEKKLAGNKPVSFDPHGGGIVCHECKRRSNGAFPISIGSAKFLEKMASTELSKANRLKPSPALFKEIEKSITAFRDSRLQSIMKTERFFAKGA